MFVNYKYATSTELPPFGPYLCEYITAANGVFVRAKRPGLEAMLPVAECHDQNIRGLVEIAPYARLDNGPIPAEIIYTALGWMRDETPRELLTWVNWTPEEGYTVTAPEQIATSSRCKPVDPCDPAGQAAQLDFHSHGNHPPFFSTTDDKDEKNGVRLYAVAGYMNAIPRMLVRVGIYGHFWTIPLEYLPQVVELPEGIIVAQKQRLVEYHDEL